MMRRVLMILGWPARHAEKVMHGVIAAYATILAATRWNSEDSCVMYASGSCGKMEDERRISSNSQHSDGLFGRNP
jgi:hypothetical protein